MSSPGPRTVASSSRSGTSLVRLLLGLALLGATGCVIDRTGQSAVSDWKRQLALQETQIQDFDRRLGLLESSIRARGRQDAEKMEDLEGVRAEVRRLRRG